MKTIIYYFTGTGNTLAVARGIADEIGDTVLLPIRKGSGTGEKHDADAIGIAFPVYFLDMPDIVKGFIEELLLPENVYIFGIATCGERPGGALFRLKDALEKEGAVLSAGFAFVMPENYIGPVDLMGDAPHRQEKFDAAKKRYSAVADAIKSRKTSAPEGTDSAAMKTGARMMKGLMTSVYGTPRRLHATDACNRCGTCALLCPTKNIRVTGKGVTWGKDCVQCYACIHWCPKAAVEIGGRTKGKPRYHHPDIKLADMTGKISRPE